MRTNTTKAKLAAGQVVFAAIIGRHAPDQVEFPAGTTAQGAAPTSSSRTGGRPGQGVEYHLLCWVTRLLA